MKYILSIDQGTTSSRAIIFDETLKIVSSAQQEFRQIYPKSGWVEHSPNDIMGSVMAVTAEAIIRAGVTCAELSAIGITNQRETALAWDKSTGEAVCNAIVWQCRRTADMCEELKKKGLSDSIYKKTGLVPDAYFSATKFKWILDNVPKAREVKEKGNLLFGTVDTYLMWRLSKGRIYATDYTNAARTMLFNIHTLDWDNELLKLFGIDRESLPEVKPSGGLFGYTDAGVFGESIPVSGVAGDQQAALFGHLCTRAGEVKSTYGTGCFLLMNTGDKAIESKNGLITTLGAGTGKPPFVLEGSVFAGGAAVQWLRDGLNIVSSAGETEELAKRAETSGGVYVVPAFTGLGAPYWDAEARGAIFGLTRGTTREQIVRATLESIAYQTNDLISAMESDSGMKITRLNVDGGAAANDFLMGFQADISGVEIIRPKLLEVTALGAAYLAGLGAGVFKDIDSVREKSAFTFLPNMSEKERKNLVKGWREAVSRTLSRK